MPRESDAKLLELAKKRFKLAMDSDHRQREREKEDLRGYAGELWSADDLTARAARPATGGLPPLPARVSLSIPLIQEPVRQIVNEERSAELGVEIVSEDDFGGLTDAQPIDEREIEVREGLIRRIQRDPQAAEARSWAFSRVAQAGRGYWGVMTKYASGKTWDQDVVSQGYYNQFARTLDPAHEQPDGSDAGWGFIGVDLPWEEYKARYGKRDNGKRNRVADATEDQFRALGDEAPGWFQSEGDVRMCRVVDYWYYERDTRTLCRLPDGSSAWEDELPEGTKVSAEDKRRVTEKQVKWCQLDGVQILDETDWPGPDIPIIEEQGERLHPYDTDRRVQGMVRHGRESMMGFNAMTSKLVETVGLTPIPPWQATPDQIEGFQEWYQLANTRQLPYLPYNLISDSGKPLGPPTRTPIDTPVTAIAQAIQLFRETLQSTTAVHDPSLGRVDPRLKSGRAIQFLQRQSQQATSNFLSNHERSLHREGTIINNLLYPVYGKRPGRLARIITPMGEAQTVAVNGPPPQNGNGQQPPRQMPTYPLTEGGSFNVTVKVSRTFESRHAEENAMLGDLIYSNPVFMTWFGDLFLESSDAPAHLELAERAKIMLDPKIQQMLQSKQQGSNIPPQVQAQIVQLQQQIAEAEKVMQQQAQELSTRQGEIQSKIQIAQLSADKDIRLQTMRDASAIAVAKIAALTKGVISDNERQVEEIALAAEQDRTTAQMQHETRLAGHQAGAEHAHAIASQQQDQVHELASMQLEHSHAMDEQQQAADLAPEPTDNESEGEPT